MKKDTQTTEAKFYIAESKEILAYFPKEHFYHEWHKDYNEVFTSYAHNTNAGYICEIGKGMELTKLTEQDEANARLIAAAPTMEAVLINWVEYFNGSELSEVEAELKAKSEELLLKINPNYKVDTIKNSTHPNPSNAEVKINIDLPLLREQKQALLNIPFNTKEQSIAIDGIIHTIDGIQDYAADVLKIDESYIYTK